MNLDDIPIGILYIKFIENYRTKNYSLNKQRFLAEMKEK